MLSLRQLLPFTALTLATGPGLAQDCQLESTKSPSSLFGQVVSIGTEVELMDSGNVFASGSSTYIDAALLAGDDSTNTLFSDAANLTGQPQSVIATLENGAYSVDPDDGTVLYHEATSGGSIFLVNLSSSALDEGLPIESMDAAGDFMAVGQPAFDGERGRVRIVRQLISGSPEFGFTSTAEADLTAFNAQPGDRFGEQVAVYSGPERDVIMVGAPGASNGGANEGAVYFYIYDEVNGDWDFNSWWWVNTPGGLYGSQLDVHGDQAAAGAPLADVGATDTGYFNVFEWDGTLYNFGPGFVASPGDMGGSAISLEDDVVVAGASGYDGPDGNRTDMGGASIIRYDGTQWSVEVPVFYAIDGRAGDRFGSALDVKNGQVAISSPNQTDPILGGQPVRVYDISEIDGFALAEAKPYFGSAGTNPVAVTTSDRPRLGSLWRCNIDNNQVPGQQIVSLVAVSDAPGDLAIGNLEYLISLTSGNPFFIAFSPNPQIGNVDIPLPKNCIWAGTSFFAQGVSLDSNLVLDLLSPAYELVLGY